MSEPFINRKWGTKTVYGNEEVIDLLETYLALAKREPYGSVAISMVARPGIAAADCAGEIALEHGQVESLGLLLDRVKQSVDDWMVPKKDESLDESYVVYNVANGPLGFDFLIWLVTAEMHRIWRGAPAPLKVGLWMGKNQHHRMMQDNRQAWVDNVFRPCIKLIGAVEDPKAVYGHFYQVYCPINIVRMHKQIGIPTPVLKATQEWDVPKDYVTITLREAAHDPIRNSNLEAWVKFAKDLQDQGERVLFVRDTAKAYQKLDDFETCPLASTNLDARMYLYENSKVNLFVANGPGGLAMFSKKPYLQFIAPDGGENFGLNNKDFWEKNNGIEFGVEQWPWSAPDQRIVWSTDNYDAIKDAYASLTKGKTING